MSRLVAICLPLAFWFGAGLGAVPGAAWLALGALLVARLSAGPAGMLLAAAAGGALCGVGEHRWQDALPAEPPTAPIEATVRAVNLRGEAVDVTLAADGSPHFGTLRLPRRPRGLAPGARVRAVGRFRTLAPADEPGGWDAASRGALDGVAWRGRGALDVLAPAPAYAEWSIRAREAARRHLAASRRPFGAAVLSGLLLGDRAAVPASARDALQATGTGHLLAVSGLHVGGLALVLGGIGLAAARRWPAVHPHRWAVALAGPAVLGFVTLAQFPLSACRAGLMVGLYLVGRGLGRRPDGVILLGWAAVVLLAGGTSGAAGAGFQLSFGAVGALLWLGSAATPCADGPAEDRISRAARRLRLAALTAVVAAGATAPVEAWHFGTVAPLAPLANLILCPLTAVVLVPLGLVGLALAPLTGLPLDLAAAGAEALTALAEVFAGQGGPWVIGRHMTPAAAIPLTVLALARAGRPRGALVAAIVLAGSAIAMRPTGSRVDFLPVGQGDAVLVRSAGRALLVDAGPDPDGFRLLGALRRAGIDRLDAVFVTHAHPDHFAGLAALLDRVDIGGVWFNGRRGGRSWQAVARRVVARGVPLRRARRGRFTLGRVAVSVLVGGTRAALSENDASLVLRVDGSAASVLLTGDLEAVGEERLLAGAPRPVTVLKAPHHGSRTSSGPALLARLCPAAVVHTVGRHNRFGLPHPAVLERYAAAGVDGYRTDRDGRVTLDLDAGLISAHRRAGRALPPAGCGLAHWRGAGGGRPRAAQGTPNRRE